MFSLIYVIVNEDQRHSNPHETMKVSDDYHCAKFELNHHHLHEPEFTFFCIGGVVGGGQSHMSFLPLNIDAAKQTWC